MWGIVFIAAIPAVLTCEQTCLHLCRYVFVPTKIYHERLRDARDGTQATTVLVLLTSAGLIGLHWHTPGRPAVPAKGWMCQLMAQQQGVQSIHLRSWDGDTKLQFWDDNQWLGFQQIPMKETKFPISTLGAMKYPVTSFQRKIQKILTLGVGMQQRHSLHAVGSHHSHHSRIPLAQLQEGRSPHSLLAHRIPQAEHSLHMLQGQGLGTLHHTESIQQEAHSRLCTKQVQYKCEQNKSAWIYWLKTVSTSSHRSSPKSTTISGWFFFYQTNAVNSKLTLSTLDFHHMVQIIKQGEGHMRTAVMRIWVGWAVRSRSWAGNIHGILCCISSVDNFSYHSLGLSHASRVSSDAHLARVLALINLDASTRVLLQALNSLPTSADNTSHHLLWAVHGETLSTDAWDAYQMRRRAWSTLKKFLHHFAAVGNRRCWARYMNLWNSRKATINRAFSGPLGILWYQQLHCRYMAFPSLFELLQNISYSNEHSARRQSSTTQCTHILWIWSVGRPWWTGIYELQKSNPYWMYTV